MGSLEPSVAPALFRYGEADAEKKEAAAPAAAAAAAAAAAISAASEASSGPDRFVVLACDGVWDVCTDQQVRGAQGLWFDWHFFGPVARSHKCHLPRAYVCVCVRVCARATAQRVSPPNRLLRACQVVDAVSHSLARGMSPHGAAKTVVDMAYELASTDNLTASTLPQ